MEKEQFGLTMDNGLQDLLARAESTLTECLARTLVFTLQRLAREGTEDFGAHMHTNMEHIVFTYPAAMACAAWGAYMGALGGEMEAEAHLANIRAERGQETTELWGMAVFLFMAGESGETLHHLATDANVEGWLEMHYTWAYGVCAGN